MLTAPGGGTFTTQPDGTVIVKKKRGRPFGSKNRRNLEAAAQGGAAAASAALAASGGTTTTANQEAYKRRRKVVCIDVGINTALSFDVHGNLTSEDTYLFTDHQQQHFHSLASVKHSLPLAMKRKKIIGPVIRIDKASGGSDGEERQTKYSVINSIKFLEEEEKDSKFSSKKLNEINPGAFTSRKSIKRCSMLSAAPVNHTTINKNWFCILCHKGPNYKGLGDLYGPYFITLDRSKLPSTHEYDNNNNMSTTTPTENNHHEDNDAYNEQQQHQNPTSERRSSLRRRQDPNEETLKASGKSMPTTTNHQQQQQQQNTNNNDEKEAGKTNLEVWIHEDCIVWSNNVYLDGTKIRNLEPAIVDSFEHVSL